MAFLAGMGIKCRIPSWVLRQRALRGKRRKTIVKGRPGWLLTWASGLRLRNWAQTMQWRPIPTVPRDAATLMPLSTPFVEKTHPDGSLAVHEINCFCNSDISLKAMLARLRMCEPSYPPSNMVPAHDCSDPHITSATISDTSFTAIPLSVAGSSRVMTQKGQPVATTSAPFSMASLTLFSLFLS